MLFKKGVLLNPTHALLGGVSYFAFVRLSVCVCVSVEKISQKVFNQSTSFLVEACDPRKKRLDFENKIAPG